MAREQTTSGLHQRTDELKAALEPGPQRVDRVRRRALDSPARRRVGVGQIGGWVASSALALLIAWSAWSFAPRATTSAPALGSAESMSALGSPELFARGDVVAVRGDDLGWHISNLSGSANAPPTRADDSSTARSSLLVLVRHSERPPPGLD